jgi:hypothetical protein
MTTAPNIREGACFDPATIEVMKAVLEDAWASIPPAQQARTTKSEMATRILAAAARGERDPSKLKTTATIYLID